MEPARTPTRSSDRRGLLLASALVVAMAAGVVALASTEHDRRSGPAAQLAALHGTRPGRLPGAEVARLARALGIQGRPRHRPDGWEAEDAVRSLYVSSSPSAWYVLFTNSSVLLADPLPDRTALCARVQPPPGCSSASVLFAAPVGQGPPSARDAATTARRILERGGIVDTRWRALVLDPHPEPVPCRPGLVTRFDCTQQVLWSRSVMLTLDLGSGRTSLGWGLTIGPGDTLISASGRIAVPR